LNCVSFKKLCTYFKDAFFRGFQCARKEKKQRFALRNKEAEQLTVSRYTVVAGDTCQSHFLPGLSPVVDQHIGQGKNFQKIVTPPNPLFTGGSGIMT
jgi:hypothetical protein